MRLFACACCRRIWHLLDDPCRRAVEVSERYADRSASDGELDAAAEQAGEQRHHYSSVAAGWYDPVSDPIDERMNSACYNAAASAERAAFTDFDFLPYHFDFFGAGSDPVVSIERKYTLRDTYLVTVREPGVDRRLAAAMAVALDALQSR